VSITRPDSLAADAERRQSLRSGRLVSRRLAAPAGAMRAQSSKRRKSSTPRRSLARPDAPPVTGWARATAADLSADQPRRGFRQWIPSRRADSRPSKATNTG
jgi:hypothetical protein